MGCAPEKAAWLALVLLRLRSHPPTLYNDNVGSSFFINRDPLRISFEGRVAHSRSLRRGRGRPNGCIGRGVPRPIGTGVFGQHGTRDDLAGHTGPTHDWEVREGREAAGAIALKRTCRCRPLSGVRAR